MLVNVFARKSGIKKELVPRFWYDGKDNGNKLGMSSRIQIDSNQIGSNQIEST